MISVRECREILRAYRQDVILCRDAAVFDISYGGEQFRNLVISKSMRILAFLTCQILRLPICGVADKRKRLNSALGTRAPVAAIPPV